MDPWSKVDYSRFIREASMVVEKLQEVVPPSGRVPGIGLLVLPMLEARWLRNRGEIAKKGSVPEGFSSRGINRRKGAARGGPGGGPRPLAAWGPLAPSVPSWALREASGTLIFPIFFPEFFWYF